MAHGYDRAGVTAAFLHFFGVIPALDWDDGMQGFLAWAVAKDGSLVVAHSEDGDYATLRRIRTEEEVAEVADELSSYVGGDRRLPARLARLWRERNADFVE